MAVAIVDKASSAPTTVWPLRRPPRGQVRRNGRRRGGGCCIADGVPTHGAENVAPYCTDHSVSDHDCASPEGVLRLCVSDVVLADNDPFRRKISRSPLGVMLSLRV